MKYLRKYLILFFILCTCQLYAASKDVIVIGADHNPPFRIIEGENYGGIYGEMIQEIVKGMNVEVQLRNIPFKRSIFELEAGKIDVFLALVKNPKREKFLYFCEPFIKNRTDRAFYLRKGEGKRIQSYDDLYGLRIGLLNGVKITPKFNNDSKLKKEDVRTHEINIKKVIAGRIDTFVHTEIAIDYQLKTLGYQSQIEKAPFKFTKEQPTYFVVSKKSKYMKRIKEFEANLQRLYKENMYWNLVDKHTK